MKKINEIFYSIQGEGFHTGTPAVFVRFSGCNLKCSFCDTKHEEGQFMSDEEICSEIAKYPAKMVVLTGGEPSLWIDEAFIREVHKVVPYIAIETNGTRELPSFGIDWITCSPKHGKGSKLRIGSADELKVVYEGQDVSGYLNFPAAHYYLQPCDIQNEELNNDNLQMTIKHILDNPIWRLSLQTQKITKVK